MSVDDCQLCISFSARAGQRRSGSLGLVFMGGVDRMFLTGSAAAKCGCPSAVLPRGVSAGVNRSGEFYNDHCAIGFSPSQVQDVVNVLKTRCL